MISPRVVYTDAEIARFYERGYWTSETLPDVLDRRADQDPRRVLLIDGDVVLDNDEVRARAYRLARGLRELGIAASDRVGVQLPNWHEYVLTYFALSRLGAVVVPLMPIYRHKEVRYILDLTEACAYVGTSAAAGSDGFDHLAMVDALRPQLPQLRHVVAVRSPGELTYAELARASGDLGPRPDPDAGHLIGFTSGTESAPKGCFHTWNSYSFTPRMQAGLYGFGPDDIELVVSPPTHTSGLAAGVLKPLVAGGASCLMPAWSPAAALDLIGRHGATMATGATPFISMMADAFDPLVHDVSTFRLFLCGGAPVPSSLVAKVRSTLKATTVLPVYGQTESLILTTCRPSDSDERVANTSGRAVDGVEVAIVGPSEEICYRTPGAMLGYWRNPKATAAVMPGDGWWHSGDVGHLDEDGYLHVTDRIKDIIIRGGVNVSSREVEELLVRHPDITAAAVVGVPDERLGERIGAFVVAERELSLPDLTHYLQCEYQLAKQKLPEVLRVVPELPMTATGKVSKRSLREQLASGQS